MMKRNDKPSAVDQLRQGVLPGFSSLSEELLDLLPEKIPTRRASPLVAPATLHVPRLETGEYGPPPGTSAEDFDIWIASERQKMRRNPDHMAKVHLWFIIAVRQAPQEVSSTLQDICDDLEDTLPEGFIMNAQTISPVVTAQYEPPVLQQKAVELQRRDSSSHTEAETSFLAAFHAWQEAEREFTSVTNEWHRSQSAARRDWQRSKSTEPFDFPASPEMLVLAQKRVKLAVDTHNIFTTLPNVVPAKSLPAVKSRFYDTPVSQEFNALTHAVTNGRDPEKWHDDEQGGTRTYKDHRTSHYVQAQLTQPAIDLGFGLPELRRLTDDQNADAAFALMYVSALIMPTQELPPDTVPIKWVDLDDVAERIGHNVSKMTLAQKEETRRKVYRYLEFATVAKVVGKRTIDYRDKRTGEIIPTRIESPLMVFHAEQKPIQPSLDPKGDVPVRVEIALSRAWVALLTHTDLKQFLPHGEMLGAIPPDKASGAWARVMGLTLSGWWRQYPKDFLEGKQLTRRQILTEYRAKTSPVEEVLRGNHPLRALDYWADALGFLAESDFIEREGEAAPGVAKQKLGPNGEELPRQGWQDMWLDTKVLIVPSAAMRETLAAIASRRYVPAPRNLAVEKRKPGRPRKNPLPAE